MKLIRQITAFGSLSLLGLGLQAAASSLLYGQAVSFAGTPTYGSGSGLAPIYGSAVDNAGNLFIVGLYTDYSAGMTAKG